MLPARHLVRPPRRVELLLATGVLALGLGEIWVPFSSRQSSGSTTSATIGVVLVAVMLLGCRRAPLLVVVGLPVAWGLIGLVAPTYVLFYGQMVPLEIGVFMAARFGAARTPLYGAVAAAGCLLGIDVFVPLLQEPGEIAFHWTVTILVWSAGFGLRTLERRAHASMRRAIHAEVAAAQQAMEAVLDERARIARELHDIVAHAVSSMVVQAGAAETGADDTEYVRKALASIRTTGNDALNEMRRVVAVLRGPDDAPLLPQPSLEALPVLVERTTAEGTQTTLTVTGETRPLPAGLDLALYRIVQEALTNVRRHAGATRCDVSVHYQPEAVCVQVVDDGRGGEPNPAASGHGLVGMRERAGLYGGELAAGPHEGGGFAVRATLPVAP